MIQPPNVSSGMGAKDSMDIVLISRVIFWAADYRIVARCIVNATAYAIIAGLRDGVARNQYGYL